MQRRDSTQNIARRYRHLFRLPSLYQVVAYASIEVLLIAAISRYVVSFASSRSVLGALPYLLATELLYIASTEVDTIILRRASGSGNIATFRRITAVSIIANAMWLILALIGFTLSLHQSQINLLKMIVLGSFFAASFRAFVFGSIFYDSAIKAVPLALLQPVLLIIPLIYGIPISSLQNVSVLVAIFCGVVVLVGIELYLTSINSTQKVKGLRPLELLQAFLNAWVIQDPQKLEQMLDLVSKERKVRTDVLVLDSGTQKEAELFVPGVHPGPFYPIGSSNLPGEIFKALHSERATPMTVHSISDHDLNLPSKHEVSRYVSSLREQTSIDSGKTVSAPVVMTKNKATVEGFALGKTAVLAITQAPHGMEDFPVLVRDKILEYSSGIGFSETLVIDTHNSQGEKPDEQETLDAIEAAKLVLDELKVAKQSSFRTAFAHSTELENRIDGEKNEDIGPGGVGLLLFDIEGGLKFSIVIFDANNARILLREEVMKNFEKGTGSRLLEICTSDTHFTAARALGGKGYLTLGDSTSIVDLSSLVTALYEKANSRLLEGGFSSLYVESEVKTAGGELLDEFSKLLDSTVNTAKRGAILLGVLGIAVVVVVAVI